MHDVDERFFQAQNHLACLVLKKDQKNQKKFCVVFIFYVFFVATSHSRHEISS